ncbi:hypothetical protein D3C77_386710 [compost metagenome]
MLTIMVASASPSNAAISSVTSIALVINCNLISTFFLLSAITASHAAMTPALFTKGSPPNITIASGSVRSSLFSTNHEIDLRTVSTLINLGPGSACPSSTKQ